MFHSFRDAVARARQHGDLYFAPLFSEDRILEAFGSARWLWQGWVYTPAVTVWVFLSQCLSSDHSCRDAVARLIGWRIARGEKPCSAETGAYCTARGNLPESVGYSLVQQTGREPEQAVPESWLWHGRRVRVLDGSTVTMPDTEANQAEYPQQSSQARGCGLPIARILVVFSLSVGTVLEAAIGPYKGKQTGENSLFRTLHEALAERDVVLADRCFSGWFDIALLAERKVDVVVRKHQLRPTDFRSGWRLGKDDHLVRWPKPPRPDWMTPEQYARLPDELELREVRVHVRQKGFRTRRLLVVTTLMDAEEYPAEEIGALYRRRWQAELHLRSIKTVLQMDHLRCKTPDRVRNEFTMHLVAYNLVRRVMAVAAFESGLFPWEVSFKGALQTINNLLAILGTRLATDAWCRTLICAVATHRVDDRPDRMEPRRIKRRPKPYKLLQQPRNDYKRRLQ
jgi:DDE family transposase